MNSIFKQITKFNLTDGITDLIKIAVRLKNKEFPKNFIFISNMFSNIPFRKMKTTPATFLSGDIYRKFDYLFYKIEKTG